MPKLHSSREIEKVLNILGFKIVSQKGSHGKFKNSAGKIVILPIAKKEIPVGTFYSILKQMDISNEKFSKLLNS
ncbi:MAG: type II toxin-antitoxin system HicA family toxin [Ignavibacteriaceae bacterium]